MHREQEMFCKEGIMNIITVYNGNSAILLLYNIKNNCKEALEREKYCRESLE
jgi:hypothetical protein